MSTPENQAFWLIKFAPFRTSWAEIVKRGTFTMRGVRNLQARNNLAAMRVGDPVLFYHSQQELAVVGLMEVSREAYPDPTSADSQWLTCDFTALRTLPHPVTLAELKTDPEMTPVPLIRQPRLSVVALTSSQFAVILKKGERGLGDCRRWAHVVAAGKEVGGAAWGALETTRGVHGCARHRI